MELRINGQDKLLTDVAANAAAIATNTTNIGDLAYTENNYITDSEPLTESVDKLDMAVNDNAAQISQLTALIELSAVENVYTANAAAGQNFVIDNTTADAKIFTVSNIPSGKLAQISVDLAMTALADFTFSNITTVGWWVEGAAPVFEIGKRYTIWFETIDGGTTWKCGVVGGFA